MNTTRSSQWEGGTAPRTGAEGHSTKTWPPPATVQSSAHPPPHATGRRQAQSGTAKPRRGRGGALNQRQRGRQERRRAAPAHTCLRPSSGGQVEASRRLGRARQPILCLGRSAFVRASNEKARAAKKPGPDATDDLRCKQLADSTCPPSVQCYDCSRPVEAGAVRSNRLHVYCTYFEPETESGGSICSHAWRFPQHATYGAVVVNGNRGCFRVIILTYPPLLTSLLRPHPSRCDTPPDSIFQYRP